MANLLRIALVVGWLFSGSQVWISSTAHAAEKAKGDHESTTDGTTTKDSGKAKDSPKAETKESDPRLAALDRMKTQLRKIGTPALKQFSSKTSEITKVNADVLSKIVDGLPDVNADVAKSLKDSFKENLAALGDRTDADLQRLVSEILFERLVAKEDPNDPTKKGDPAAADKKKFDEAVEKALAAKDAELKKGQDDQKKALEDFTKGLNKQLDDLFKASQLAKNDDDKNNKIGDIPPPNDTGAGSGDGGGDKGGGGDGGGGDKGGGDKGSSAKGNDKPIKDSKKDTENKPLNFANKEKTSSDLAKADKGEEFKLDTPKEKSDKPSTIKTGADIPKTAAGENTDVFNPSVPPAAPNQIQGGSSVGGTTASSASSAPEVVNGGGAGIQIASASGSPLSSGDGNIFSGLGSTPYQGGDDRARYFYQRTSDKDWVGSSGSLADGYGGGGSDSSEQPSYGARVPASTLASLGITAPREDSAVGDARGVFAASSLKKLCRSAAGASVGVCSPRAVRASQSGSLYEKAKRSGFIRASR